MKTLVERTAIEAAAQRLIGAAASRVPCAPVRDLIGSADAAAAYAVQKILTEQRVAAGAKVIGRKIGLTSPVVQAQLGVGQPDFGVLFDDMALADGAFAPSERLLQPKVEAEVAFVLGADLAEGPLDSRQIRASVDFLVAALEIVDSRIEDWDISFADTVADNASSGLFVLGPEKRTLSDVDPVAVQMQMRVDGDVVSTGTGAACLGDPLNALAWLAQTARAHGSPLLAGQVILSGALGPMYPVTSGSHVVADIRGLGIVTASVLEEKV